MDMCLIRYEQFKKYNEAAVNLFFTELLLCHSLLITYLEFSMGAVFGGPFRFNAISVFFVIVIDFLQFRPKLIQYFLGFTEFVDFLEISVLELNSSSY